MEEKTENIENIHRNNIDIKYIFLRSETLKNEFRTPLVPDDVPTLINNGIIVYVESCSKRIYKDEEFSEKGAIITYSPWYSHEWDSIKNDMIIIGIKELIDLEKLNGHIHCYFSHSFKGQKDSSLILESFKKTSSVLCDFEYFLYENKRLISFSYFAGVTGCALGLCQYILKLKGNPPLKNLKLWTELSFMIKTVNRFIYCMNSVELRNTKIAIIGDGACAKGVKFILNTIGLPYKLFLKEEPKDSLDEYNIIYNCIKLDDKSNEIFISTEKANHIKKNMIIVDISCDSNKYNNPIPLYKEETTWEIGRAHV